MTTRIEHHEPRPAPTTPPPTAGDVPGPGVGVLSNRVLWDRITGFQTGYPFAVHRFRREKDPVALFQFRNGSGRGTWYGRMYAENGVDGVLPCLAIVADDLQMLELLYKLSKHPQYRSDPRLSFQKAMPCAVMYGRVSALEVLNRLKTGDRDWKWEKEPYLMRLALERDDPDLQVCRWLVAHLPASNYSLTAKDVIYNAKRGNLDIVQWLHEHECKISRPAVNDAASHGHAHVLGYLYEHSTRRANRDAIETAVAKGFLDVVKLVVANRKAPFVSKVGISKAVMNDRMDMVTYFVENKTTLSFSVASAVNSAIARGHLHIIKYLHANFPDCCTVSAINRAAEYGRFDIMKYLVQHTTEDCTKDPSTLERAAAAGYLDVVKFFHETYGLQCTVGGLDGAASRGYLDVVKYMYEQCGIQCSVDAMDYAARGGHLEVVKYMYKQCGMQCSVNAMSGAARGGHLEVVKFLHLSGTESCTEAAMRSAVKSGHTDVVRFLCEHRPRQDIVSLLTLVVDHQPRQHFEIFQYLLAQLEPGESAYGALEAVVTRRWCYYRNVIDLLFENQDREPMSFLTQAVARGSSDVVRAVVACFGLDELIGADENALEICLPEIESKIDRVICERKQAEEAAVRSSSRAV